MSMLNGAYNDGYLGLHANDASAQNLAVDNTAFRQGNYYYNTLSGRYRYWDGAVWTDGFAPISLDSAYNGGIGITVDAGAVQLTAPLPNTAVLATDEGGGNNAVLFSNGALVLGGAAMTGGNMLRVVGNALITGDMVVKGTFFSTEAETVLINDNHLYLNNGYGLNVAQTGGLVVNYLPTAVTDTVNGAFTPGVGGVSNPSVVTTGAGTYAVGDLIQISGAAVEENNGLYEVLSHVGTLLKIRGVGLTGTVEDFTQNQFVVDAGGVGNIVQVTVSVIRAGLAGGLWEEGQGSTTPIVFNTIAVAPGGAVTLDSAYDGGGAGLGRQITVDSRSVQLNADISTVLNNEEVFFVNVSGAETSGTRANGIYVFSNHTMNHANSEFQGIEVELSSITLTNFSNLWGLSIALGALLSAGGGGEVNGIHATSDDGTVKILTNDGLISLILADTPASLVRIGSPTTAINVDLLVNGTTGIEISDPLSDDTHALIITRQNTVENLGARAGSAVALNYTIGAMDVGILASSIMNEVFDNAGALGGILSGMTLLLDGVSGSLAQKQGIRMIISGTMDNGLDDEGYFLTVSHTLDNAGLFHGFYGDLQSLGLTNFSYVSGLTLLLPDDGLAINSPIRGIAVTMPVVYGGSDMAGAEITGNGNSLYLCNNTWTIEAQIGNVAIDQGQLVVNGTVFNTNERVRVNLNANAQQGIYIDANTNPLTVSSTIIDISVLLNQPAGFVSGLSVVATDSVVNVNVMAFFGTTVYETILNKSTTIMIGHYVQIDGKRSVGAPDYGVYINASQEIDDGGATFTGVSIQESGITATNYSEIFGAYIEMPDDTLNTGLPIYGIKILMPNPYTGSDMAGIVVSGDGRYVAICNDDYAIQATGDVYIAGREMVDYNTVDALTALDITRTGGTGRAISITLGASNPGIYIDNATTSITAAKSIINITARMGAVGGIVYGMLQTLTASAGFGAYIGSQLTYTSTLANPGTVGGFALEMTAGSQMGNCALSALYFYTNNTIINHANAQMRGIHLSMASLAITDCNYVAGVDIAMPGGYTAGKQIVGVKVAGDSRTVEICNNTEALKLILPATENGILIDNNTTAITGAKSLITLGTTANPVSINAGANDVIGIDAVLQYTGDCSGVIYGHRVRYNARATGTQTHTAYRAEVASGGITVTGAQQYYGFQFSAGANTLNNASIIYAAYDMIMSGIVATNYLQIFGMRLLLPNDPTPVNRVIHGIDITMPGAYTGTAIRGIRVTGDGRTLDICDTNYALYCQGEARFTNYVDMTGGSGFWFRAPQMTSVQRTAMTAAWGAGDAGKEWYNTTTNQWEGWNGAAIVIIG